MDETKSATGPNVAPRAELGATAEPPAQPARARPAATGGFDANQPTIISLLYLASFVTGITAIVGVVLAYVWKDSPKAEWEASHYRYLIRTFWIGLIGSAVGFVLLIVLVGLFVWLATAALVGVRSVLSLINAQKHVAMPNPDSWLI